MKTILTILFLYLLSFSLIAQTYTGNFATWEITSDDNGEVERHYDEFKIVFDSTKITLIPNTNSVVSLDFKITRIDNTESDITQYVKGWLPAPAEKQFFTYES